MDLGPGKEPSEGRPDAGEVEVAGWHRAGKEGHRPVVAGMAWVPSSLPATESQAHGRRWVETQGKTRHKAETPRGRLDQPCL